MGKDDVSGLALRKFFMTSPIRMVENAFLKHGMKVAIIITKSYDDPSYCSLVLMYGPSL